MSLIPLSSLRPFVGVVIVISLSGRRSTFYPAQSYVEATLDLPPWRPMLDLIRVDRGLMLPILLYCVDPSVRPMLGPPREGPETGEFLRTAYQDIPHVVHVIREFWMPERMREASGQR